MMASVQNWCDFLTKGWNIYYIYTAIPLAPKTPLSIFLETTAGKLLEGGWAFYEAMCCVYCPPHLSKRSQMVTVNRIKTGTPWHLEKFNMLNSILPLKILAWCHCAQKSHRIFNPVLHKYRKYWNYRKAGFISPKPRPLRKPKKSEVFNPILHCIFVFLLLKKITAAQCTLYTVQLKSHTSHLYLQSNRSKVYERSCLKII